MKQDVNYIKHLNCVNQKIFDSDISSSDVSLYNALFQLWNNCGFDTELSINRNDVMKLSKIGSVNTYLKGLKKLHSLGFLNYKPSHNPLKGSIINLFRFDTSSEQVVNKYSTSSDTTTDTTRDTLYKLLNRETIKLINKNYDLINVNLKKWIEQENDKKVTTKETSFSFDEFWQCYPKKVGKTVCEKKYNSIPEKDRLIIKNTIDDFVKNKPFKDYVHPNPLTYINQKRWLDEVEEESNSSIPEFEYDFSNGLDINEFNRLKKEHEQKYS